MKNCFKKLSFLSFLIPSLFIGGKGQAGGLTPEAIQGLIRYYQKMADPEYSMRMLYPIYLDTVLYAQNSDDLRIKKEGACWPCNYVVHPKGPKPDFYPYNEFYSYDSPFYKSQLPDSGFIHSQNFSIDLRWVPMYCDVKNEVVFKQYVNGLGQKFDIEAATQHLRLQLHETRYDEVDQILLDKFLKKKEANIFDVRKKVERLLLKIPMHTLFMPWTVAGYIGDLSTKELLQIKGIKEDVFQKKIDSLRRERKRKEEWAALEDAVFAPWECRAMADVYSPHTSDFTNSPFHQDNASDIAKEWARKLFDHENSEPPEVLESINPWDMDPWHQLGKQAYKELSESSQNAAKDILQKLDKMSYKRYWNLRLQKKLDKWNSPERKALFEILSSAAIKDTISALEQQISEGDDVQALQARYHLAKLYLSKKEFENGIIHLAQAAEGGHEKARKDLIRHLSKAYITEFLQGEAFWKGPLCSRIIEARDKEWFPPKAQELLETEVMTELNSPTADYLQALYEAICDHAAGPREEVRPYTTWTPTERILETAKHQYIRRKQTVQTVITRMHKLYADPCPEAAKGLLLCLLDSWKERHHPLLNEDHEDKYNRRWICRNGQRVERMNIWAFALWRYLTWEEGFPQADQKWDGAFERRERYFHIEGETIYPATKGTSLWIGELPDTWLYELRHINGWLLDPWQVNYRDFQGSPYKFPKYEEKVRMKKDLLHWKEDFQERQKMASAHWRKLTDGERKSPILADAPSKIARQRSYSWEEGKEDARKQNEESCTLFKPLEKFVTLNKADDLKFDDVKYKGMEITTYVRPKLMLMPRIKPKSPAPSYLCELPTSGSITGIIRDKEDNIKCTFLLDSAGYARVGWAKEGPESNIQCTFLLDSAGYAQVVSATETEADPYQKSRCWPTGLFWLEGYNVGGIEFIREETGRVSARFSPGRALPCGYCFCCIADQRMGNSLRTPQLQKEIDFIPKEIIKSSKKSWWD